MNFSQLFRILKIVTIAAAVALLIFLFWQKAVIGGVATYSTRFDGESNFIYGPYPIGRVERISGVVNIKDEPVYFDIYAPRQFKTANVKLTYKNESKLTAYLGVKLPGEWNFFLAKLEPSGADFHGQIIEFDVASAWRVDNVMKFILACSGLGESEKRLKIEKMEVKFFK